MYREWDPELRAAGLMMKIVNNTFSTAKLRFFGRLSRLFIAKIDDPNIDSAEHHLPRSDGSLLRVRLYRPRRAVPATAATQAAAQRNPRAAVLWLHGGGYAMGSPEQSLRIARKLIATADCVVVAPAYRLSGEAAYPAALEDAYAALIWMQQQAPSWGVGVDRLMIGGESAGGGLAAALALYARDRGEVAIALQMLVYPMLDDRMTTASATNNNAPVWNSRSNRNAWRLYLGPLYRTHRVPAYAAPARATNLAGLPPAAVYVGDLEPFRDETVLYVERLRQAGVPVQFRLFAGCYHGFDIVPSAVGRQAGEFLMSAFAQAVCSPAVCGRVAGDPAAGDPAAHSPAGSAHGDSA